MSKAELTVTGALLVALCLPAAMWTEPANRDRRRAALTLPLFVLLAVALELLAWWGCRLGLPLRDAELGRADARLGLDVSAIVAWISAYPLLARASWAVYASLDWLMRVAVFAPALLGKREAAWRFLVANVIAIAICGVFFILFPAIGPWVLHGGAMPSLGQKECEAAIVAAREGLRPLTPVLICFPSFHVVWAVLAVDALWWVRRARVPLAVLGGLIIASTLTTGWHYAVDVLAGGGIAVGSLVITKLLWGWRSHAIPPTLAPAQASR